MTNSMTQPAARGLKTESLWRWHSAVGWIAGLAACLWVISGLLHVVMTWTTPRAAAMAAPEATFEGAMIPDIQKLLQRTDGATVSAARLAMLDGTPHLYLRPSNNPEAQLVRLSDGKAKADGDRQLAIALARHYAGDLTSPIKATRLVTAFDSDYPPIYRLLPVWRVDFDRADGLAAYVDTSTGRLGSLTTPQKEFLLWAFRTIHTFGFADGVEVARVALIAGLLITIMGGTAAGVGLLLRIKLNAKAPPLRRWHHRVGLIAWIPAAMFAGSALFHLVVQSQFVTPDPVAAPQRTFTVAALSPTALAQEGAIRDARLVASADGLTLWRLTFAEGVAYTDARSGLPTVLQDHEVAAAIAGVDPTTLTEQPRLLTRFTDDYGFANKRLPVWQFPVGNDLLFVDTIEGIVAARHRPIDALEGRVFSWLHKWDFLTEPVGRIGRDLVMVLSAVILATSAILGLRLKLRRRRRPLQPSMQP
jgi:hypothetical protein